jgi:hypothetical protein
MDNRLEKLSNEYDYDKKASLAVEFFDEVSRVNKKQLDNQFLEEVKKQIFWLYSYKACRKNLKNTSFKKSVKKIYSKEEAKELCKKPFLPEGY